MPKIKAKRGDETVDFEYDEIVEPPEGLYTESDLEDNYVRKDYFQDEVKRRISGAKKNAREELAEDEEFIRNQIRKRGGEFDENGKLKAPKDVDIDKLTEDIRSEIYSEEVEPLKKENKSLKSSQLSSQVLRVGQKEGLTQHALRPVRGGKSLIELMAEDQFRWHPDKGRYAQVDEEGNFLGGANGLRTIEDWFKDLKKDPENEDLFKDPTQGGSNYQGGRQGGKPDNDFEQMKQKVKEIRGR